MGDFETFSTLYYPRLYPVEFLVCSFVHYNHIFIFLRLLDHLSQEPPWAEGDICLECGAKFGLTMRKHHW